MNEDEIRREIANLPPGKKEYFRRIKRGVLALTRKDLPTAKKWLLLAGRPDIWELAQKKMG